MILLIPKHANFIQANFIIVSKEQLKSSLLSFYLFSTRMYIYIYILYIIYMFVNNIICA